MPSDPDIQASLVEAANYERLKWNRRRGVVNLAIAVIVGLFVLERALPGDPPDWLALGQAFALLGLMLGAIWYKRRNPAWLSVFDTFPAPPPFWRDPIRLTGMFAILVFMVLQTVAEESLSGSSQTLVIAASILFMGAANMTATLRSKDWIATWAMAASCVLVAAAILLGAVPGSIAILAVLVAYALPMAVVGLYRLVAPPRWLR